MHSLKSSSPFFCFPDCWKVSLVIPVFKNVGEMSTAKNYHPVSLLSVVSKAFEKPVKNGIVDHLEKCDLFLISSVVLGLVDQPKIFLQLYLKELLGLLTGLALIELQDLIYSRLLTVFGVLVYFTNLCVTEFQVICFASFLLSSVISSFEWFRMGSLHKNIQLMLKFLKALFWVLHFSCYTLMTFLMMLSVILHLC